MTKPSAQKWLYPLIILGLAILVIAVLKSTQPSPSTQESTEKAWLVDTEIAQISAHHPELSLLGTVQSPFESDLSSTIQADVLEVLIREGSRVLQGDNLIKLDQRDIQSRVSQRRSDLAELKATESAEYTRFKADQRSLREEQRLLEVANEAFARQQKLKSSKLIAQERLEQAESAVAQAALAVSARQQAIEDHPNRLSQLKARLARAQALLEDAERDLERSIVTAPFDGTITQVNVAPGDRVQVGQGLLSLYDTRAIEVRAQLPNRHFPEVQTALDQGQPILAEIDHYGQHIAAKLVRIAGQTNANAGGVDAFFVPVDPETNLVLNSAVSVSAKLPALDNTLSLPVSSLYGTNRIYQVIDERLTSTEVNILGRFKDQTGKTRLIFSSPEINNGDVLTTTQLPNAISGLKVITREQQASSNKTKANSKKTQAPLSSSKGDE